MAPSARIPSIPGKAPILRQINTMDMERQKDLQVRELKRGTEEGIL